ncbi:MAG: hypothetical protein NTY01_09725 [Verrucomicrobia bacterium]|nr:hypothetical protein [Verrucomicrobiota bacterium]
MKTLYFHGKPGPVQFGRLIKLMPDATFDRSTKSSIPVLAFWKQPQAFDRFSQKLKIETHGQVQICFEYPVRSADKHSKSSFSDVMCITDDYAIAIEGKWTECRGDRVEKWRKRVNAEHRESVLKHWLCCIERFTKRRPDENGLDDAIYQMLHRTASACVAAEGGRKACVVYQCFRESDKQKPKTGSDLKHLKKIIFGDQPMDRLRFFVLDVQIKRTHRFQELNKHSANQLRDALLAGPLFEFESLEGHEI